MKRKLVICATMVAAMSVAASPTRACDGCGYGYAWGYGYGYLYNILRFEVPHFAAFPPVYYSYPVPRTYGYSPFAYPPYVMTPEIVGEAQPLEIVNPHVPSSHQKSADEETDRTAAVAQPEPLVIVNPFVESSRAVAQSAR